MYSAEPRRTIFESDIANMLSFTCLLTLEQRLKDCCMFTVYVNVHINNINVRYFM